MDTLYGLALCGIDDTDGNESDDSFRGVWRPIALACATAALQLDSDGDGSGGKAEDDITTSHDCFARPGMTHGNTGRKIIDRARNAKRDRTLGVARLHAYSERTFRRRFKVSDISGNVINHYLCCP